ncbi:MAG: hypothetical protein ACJA01_000508 [Saprospiraceae bacterium]|jgi:hypothetical protein
MARWYPKFIEYFYILTLCIAICQGVSAQQFPDERQITIDLVNVPLDSALLLLSKASGVNISYDTPILPDKNVTLSANYLKLGLALDNALINTNLKYKIVGNQLVIVEKYIPLLNDIVTISGRVVDEKSGELLAHVNVFTSDFSYTEVTNEYGFYSISIPRSQTYNLTFSYVGYQTILKQITPVDNIDLDVYMNAYNLLNEIVITSEVPKKSKQAEQYDQMPLDLLASLPGLGGETDIIRLAQMRSGVTTQADGFGGLLVRGGSIDQNLILLDGVPVYNTGHALGLFSVFNSSAIKNARLIKGGIPARYGGRLSSVFDIQTKEGNNQEFHGEFSISPLIAKGTIEGPISKGKSSFFVTGRRTIVDPWLKPFSKFQLERNDQEGQINFYFYDLNAKLNFDLGKKDQIFLSAYSGRDKYFNQVIGSEERSFDQEIEELDQTDLFWGNQIATLRWTHQYSSKVFGRASLSNTTFNFESFDFDRTRINPGTNNEKLNFNYKLFGSDISDQIASYELDWYAKKSFYLRIGASYTSHKLTPGVDYGSPADTELNPDLLLIRDSISTNSLKITGQEIRAYIENEFRFGRLLVVNLGGHFSQIISPGKTFTSFQPRFSSKLNLGYNTSLKFGYTKMNQYFHLLSSGGFGLPNEVWLPSTSELPPEQSQQFSASFNHNLNQEWQITIGAYHKNYSSVIGYTQGGPFEIKEGEEWQSEVPIGTGSAKGAEIEIEKLTGPIRGWLSYTLGNSKRKFDAINDGEEFRATGDRKHMFHVNTLARLNKNLEIGVSWTYGSGAPFSKPTKRPVPINGEVFFLPRFEKVNNASLPAYHKLDINLTLYNKYDWGQQKFSVGVYNAYGNRNPFYIDIVSEGTDFGVEQLSLIPFLPYVSLSLAF